MTTPHPPAHAAIDAPSFSELATEPVPLSTGFGTGSGDAQRNVPGAGLNGAVLDVCHVGVVLRALLFVHAVLAIGTAFNAADAAGWSLQFAAASGVAVPALLWWLLTMCAARRLLARIDIGAQWAVVSAWGAASAVAPWLLWGWLQTAEPRAGSALQATAVAATGAAVAAALFQWLRQRAQLAHPAAARARLAELQSRIRPHFLFNTLNTAIALVRVDPSRAEAVLEDLAELFRVALADDQTAQRAATLAEEVELARRYLAIEQIRFGERLQVRWELDAAVDAARLPPLLLQPLVENAVRHGIEPAPGGGLLRVRTRVRRGQAEILVANSVPAQGSQPGHGIALANVRERLRLMHDVAAEFRAGRDGEVYRVEIVVPL